MIFICKKPRTINLEKQRALATSQEGTKAACTDLKGRNGNVCFKEMK